MRWFAPSGIVLGFAATMFDCGGTPVAVVDDPSDAASDAGGGGAQSDVVAPIVDGGDQSDSGGDASIDCTNELSVTGTAVAGKASAARVTASKGNNVTFSSPSASGLSVQPDGTITGTASKSGNVTLDVTATWANRCSAHQSVVVAVGCPEQSIKPATMTRMMVETGVGRDLEHEGGVGASTFTVVDGAWPGGVTFSSAGAVRGTPAFGKQHVAVRATDSAGCVSNVTYDFPVCDLVGWPVPQAWSPSTYYTGSSPGSDGWINGNNAARDKEKAAPFDMSALAVTNIASVTFQVGQAQTNTSSLTVGVRVYDGTSGSPGALLGTAASVTMATIVADFTAGRLSQVDLPVTLPASKKVFVSFDLTNLRWDATNKDVFSLMSNQNGQTTPSQVWEKHPDNTWHQYGTTGSWPLNVSLYVFPTACPAL